MEGVKEQNGRKQNERGKCPWEHYLCKVKWFLIFFFILTYFVVIVPVFVNTQIQEKKVSRPHWNIPPPPTSIPSPPHPPAIHTINLMYQNYLL